MLNLDLRMLLTLIHKTVDCWLLFQHQLQLDQPHSKVAEIKEQAVHQHVGALGPTGMISELSAILPYLSLIL